MSTVQHMVLMRFKPDVTEVQIEDLLGKVRAVRAKIPGIIYVAAGSNSSPEGLNKGYTHGFLITFTSSGARDAYLTHPEHERLKADLLASIEDGLVFDFET